MNLNTNLVIHGPCGTGKTWLACAIANEAIKQRHKTFYIRLPRLLELHDNMRNSGKSLSQAVQKYAKYELLILDE